MRMRLCTRYVLTTHLVRPLRGLQGASLGLPAGVEHSPALDNLPTHSSGCGWPLRGPQVAQRFPAWGLRRERLYGAPNSRYIPRQRARDMCPDMAARAGLDISETGLRPSRVLGRRA